MAQLPEQSRYQHPYLSAEVTADDFARLKRRLTLANGGGIKLASDLKIAFPGHPILRHLQHQALLAEALEVNGRLTHRYDNEGHIAQALEYAAASRLVLADTSLSSEFTVNPRLLEDAVRALRHGKERGIGVFKGAYGIPDRYGAAIAANLALIDPEKGDEFRIEDEWAFAKDLFDENSSLMMIDPPEIGSRGRRIRRTLEWGVHLKLLFPDRAGEITGGAALWDQTRELLEELRAPDHGFIDSVVNTYRFVRVLRDAKILASPSVHITSKGLELG